MFFQAYLVHLRNSSSSIVPFESLSSILTAFLISSLLASQPKSLSSADNSLTSISPLPSASYLLKAAVKIFCFLNEESTFFSSLNPETRPTSNLLDTEPSG